MVGMAAEEEELRGELALSMIVSEMVHFLL